MALTRLPGGAAVHEVSAQVPPDCPSALVWRLHRDRFREVVAAATQRTIAERSRWLADVPLFSALSPRQLASVASLLRTRSFRPLEYVIRQGERGDDFFLIQVCACRCSASVRPCVTGDVATQEGEAVVRVRGDASAAEAAAVVTDVAVLPGAEVARLHAGNFFGEMALLYNEPRSADIVASGGPALRPP